MHKIIAPQPDARTDSAEDDKLPEQGTPPALESNPSLLSFFQGKKPANKDPNKDPYNGSGIVSKNLKGSSKNSMKTERAGASRKEK